MKINSNISLPYPVLGRGDDYIITEDDTTLIVNESQDDNSYYFDCTLGVNQDEIKALIREGKAKYSCEIECKNTFFWRNVFVEAGKIDESGNGTIRIPLDKKDVNGAIYINFYVTATDNISFTPADKINNDYCYYLNYLDSSFIMKPGDVLAWLGKHTKNVDITEKNKYINNCFAILKDEDADYMRYERTEEKIIIYLPKDDFDIFTNIDQNRDFYEVYRASILLPILVQILKEYNEEEQGECRWARVIKMRLEQDERLSGFNMKEDAFELAQAFMEKPYNKMFTKLETLQTHTEIEPQNH